MLLLARQVVMALFFHGKHQNMVAKAAAQQMVSLLFFRQPDYALQPASAAIEYQVV